MPAKRALSAALTLLLAVSFAAPSGARALSAGGFNYTVADGVATVTGCTVTCPAALVIPETLGGYSVTSIGDLAFISKALTSVTIPNSVTGIGNLAFALNALTTVTIPNSVTTIGTNAFNGNALTTVTIGSSVMSIGDGAFYSNALTTVTIGSSVTSIGDGAFYGNALTTVTIPNSVTSIGNSAFYDNALTTVTIPNSVTSIGNFAFQGNALTTLTIGNSVTSIDDWAFYNNALTSVTFLGDAPTAGGNVFDNNSGLTSVTRSYTATGWGSTWSGVAVVIADARATATVKPTVTGTSTVGKTLTAAKGTWTGYPTPTFTYQWYACTTVVSAARATVPTTCTKITGATRSTFKLTSAQRGKYVAVFVKGTSLRTTATTWLSKTTAAVVIADARATATVKPTVTGTSTVGRTLTAAKGTWTGYPTPTFTYQWYACTTVVSAARATVPTTCTKITGATRSTFKLTSAQRGKYVAVFVKGTSLRTTATTWLSKTTAKVR